MRLGSRMGCVPVLILSTIKKKKKNIYVFVLYIFSPCMRLGLRMGWCARPNPLNHKKKMIIAKSPKYLEIHRHKYTHIYLLIIFSSVALAIFTYLEYNF